MKRVPCAAAVAALLVLAMRVQAAELGPTRPARLDAWRVIGPGGGGTMRRPALSPHDPKGGLLGCGMTGAPAPGPPASPTLLLGSTDGGRTWARVTAFASERIFALRVDGRGRDPGVRAI